MSSDARFGMSILLTFVALVAGVLLCGAVWGKYECDAHWRASGMRSSFGIVQGCIVEVSPGRWMPEDSVRTLP